MKRYISKITHYLVILLVLGFVLIPTCVFAKAKIPTQSAEFYVNDFADVLTETQEKEPEEMADLLHHKSEQNQQASRQ